MRFNPPFFRPKSTTFPKFQLRSFSPLQLESVRSPSGLETLKSACWSPRRPAPSGRRPRCWTPWQRRSWSPTAGLTSACCCSRWPPTCCSLSTRRPETATSGRGRTRTTRRRETASTGAASSQTRKNACRKTLLTTVLLFFLFRERVRYLRAFSRRFLVCTSQQHKEILTQMGLENFCAEPYFCNLRHDMRELVEVLAAVAAGVPRHRHGFHRSEALPPQEPPRVWVSMVTPLAFSENSPGPHGGLRRK